MSRSTSRLSTLRNVRAAAREERLRRLADALQAENVLETQKTEFEQQQAALQQTRRAAVSPLSINLNRLVDAQRFGVVLAAEQRVLDDQRTTLSAEVERRRQELVHADREVRAVERLERKHAAKERVDQMRAENRELDETALTAFIRRKA